MRRGCNARVVAVYVARRVGVVVRGSGAAEASGGGPHTLGVPVSVSDALPVPFPRRSLAEARPAEHRRRRAGAGLRGHASGRGQPPLEPRSDLRWRPQQWRLIWSAQVDRSRQDVGPALQRALGHGHLQPAHRRRGWRSRAGGDANGHLRDSGRRCVVAEGSGYGGHRVGAQHEERDHQRRVRDHRRRRYGACSLACQGGPQLDRHQGAGAGPQQVHLRCGRGRKGSTTQEQRRRHVPRQRTARHGLPRHHHRPDERGLEEHFPLLHAGTPNP